MFALLFFALLLLLFAAGTMVVLFHLNQYAVPGDHTGSIRTLFLLGSAFFFVASTVAFMLVPWNDLFSSL